MEAALQALFNVITDIEKVEVNPSLTREVEVSGEFVERRGSSFQPSPHLDPLIS